MIAAVRQDQQSVVVLVVDAHTARILSSCTRMYTLMEAGVISLQSLALNREPLRDMNAIYFISPSRASVDRLVADFADRNRPQYNSAHLFFPRHVQPPEMQVIGAAKHLVARIKTFKEIDVDFLALEERVFSFGTPEALRELYFPRSREDYTDAIARDSAQLVSLLTTLQERPRIHFWSKSKNGMCETFARAVQRTQERAIAGLGDRWKPHPQRPAATLLIVDRSLDPIAPVMHEFTYQSMLYDLGDVRGELALLPKPTKPGGAADDEKQAEEAPETPEERQARITVLSEEDAMWLKYRHLHIGAVSQDVSAEYRRFVASNSTAQVRKKMEQDKSQVTIAELSRLMREMPKYQSIVKGFYKHQSLAEQCLTLYKRKHLEALGNLQQDMATGLDKEGNKTNDKQIKSRLIELCQNPEIGVQEKLRLLMVYVASREGIPDASRRQLLANIDERLQGVLLQLEKLGVEIGGGAAGGAGGGEKLRLSKPRQTELAKHLKALQNDPNSMILMRYLPVLHSVMSDLAAGKLEPAEYPCINGDVVVNIGGAAASPVAAGGVGAEAGDKKGFLGGGKMRWRRNKDKDAAANADPPAQKQEEDLRPRFIVYVMGGMTHSEIRSAYEIAQKQGVNLLLGGNAPLVARDFVRCLAGMSRREYREAVGEPAQDPWEDEEEAGEGLAPAARVGAGVSLEQGADERKQQLSAFN